MLQAKVELYARADAKAEELRKAGAYVGMVATALFNGLDIGDMLEGLVLTGMNRVCWATSRATKIHAAGLQDQRPDTCIVRVKIT